MSSPVNDPPAVAAFCRACGEELIPGARFCEACGEEADVPAGRATVTSDSTGGCSRCGAEVGDDGYCTSCGLKAVEAITVEGRGSYAYATHRGRRHPRNEDAAALARTSEGWPVVAVADGVSASPNPHLAAAAAVAAAAGELGEQRFTGPDDLVRAVAAAHQAACDVPADGDPQWPADGTHPACTIVVAVATGESVHVANIGDARAYLLTAADRPAGTADTATSEAASAETSDAAESPDADQPAGGATPDTADTPEAADAEATDAAESPDADEPAGGATGDAAAEISTADAADVATADADASANGPWAAIQLTTDDSMAALAVREGVEPAVALTLPDGHAVTAWLGADAPDPAAHVATRAATPDDLLLVCSDGLWNYAPTDEALAALASATLPPPTEPIGNPAKVCEHLVSWAIDQGGSDNICVGLTPAGPMESIEPMEPVEPAPEEDGAAPSGATATDATATAPDDAEQTDQEEEPS